MDVLTLSRVQFGDTAAFHILWPLLSIGLALFMFVLEAVWLYTKDERYYRQTRFWSKIFILTFGIGTASGIPLEFEFGTNWAAFSSAAGDFFGNILGFESTVAFALEAAFLGIFVFGWKRVRPLAHLFANGMVGLGASLSAFWIMVANSWMQAPRGIAVEGGRIIVTDYSAAIFNPASMVSVAHMLLACFETALFFVGGICALALLRESRKAPGEADPRLSGFYLLAFQFALGLAVIVTPLQIGIGDLSGSIVARYQPEKLAAAELHWDTNAPGEGAPWAVLAWPAREGGKNAFALEIPGGLSLLATHSRSGTVRGLNDFPAEERPTPLESVIVFYSFRIMIVIGFILLLLMLWGLWLWRKGALAAGRIAAHRLFWRAWAFAIPLGFVATEAGWMVREIGRQPWIVYHVLRTSEGLSSGLSSAVVATTTALITAMYLAFGIFFVYFTWRIVKKGPDFLSAAPLP